MQTERNLEHKRSTEESPLVEVRRTFRAPVETVFEAWRNARLIEQWWGPEGFTCPYAMLDFKVEDTYLFCMKGEGQEIWSTGSFLQIETNQRIVMSDLPSNERGEITEYPKSGPFADVGAAYITVEFFARGDNETEMFLSHEGLPKRMHDECVEGWNSSFNKLQKVVERH